MSTSINLNASIAIGGCLPPDRANPTHASTRMEGGQAVFENDNYRITAGDNNQVNIYNKRTGETYQVWGDPHVNVDGQHAFDFWGTTTFKLDDGTKVTIQTTPWAHNPNATLASKVTITNGDYGVQITGVDTNTHGDLKINEAKGWGEVLDWAVDDGNTVQENPTGKGFLAVDGNGTIHAVDQGWINKTDLTKGGKPALDDKTQQLVDAFKGAFSFLSGLVSISFLGGLLAGFEAGARAGGPHDNGRGRDDVIHHRRPDVGFEPWIGGSPTRMHHFEGLQLAASVSLTIGRV
jgi:hypothetical protein